MGSLTPPRFVVTLSDADGATTTANGIIDQFIPINDAPIAVDDSGAGFRTDRDTSFVLPSLTLNDFDEEGDDLVVTAIAETTINPGGSLTLDSGAIVTLNADGALIYDPNGAFDEVLPNETIVDTFTYTISDGNGASDTASVSVEVLANSSNGAVVGDDSDNELIGSDNSDLIAGAAGSDAILGGAGDDVLRGDLNSRAAQAGKPGGNDFIDGGAGDDRIGGKAGNDTLFGSEGNDRTWGDDGDDILRGGLGNDTLTGDDFSGGQGVDIFVIATGKGTDTIVDFEVGIDFIGLAEGLTFADLSFSGNTLLAGGETLATFQTVAENELNLTSNFISV